MKNHSLRVFLSLAVVLSYALAFSQNVGVNTETPEAILDVNGDVIFRPGDLLLQDVPEQVVDVNTSKFSFYRITGPTADFEIAGITGGIDGRIVTLFNRSGFAMTLHPEDPDALPEEGILTPNAEDLVVPNRSMVSLYYDATETRWVVQSSSKVSASTMGWDTSGNNVFYENNVGIGTSEPFAPLTIQTDTGAIGMTQIGGEDSITIATRINEVTAAIGTSSDHIFSLNAGGSGKVHIWPDGDVVFGEEEDALSLLGTAPTRNEFDSKITVLTGTGEAGFTHIGTGETETIEVNEAIGGVSSSLGTMSNHTFRLKTNGLGRLHVLPDGRITISPNDYFAHGQLTVHTDNNSFGYSHLGGDGQIVASRVGGVLGSAGFGTYSPHHMRIVCNGTNAISIWNPTMNVGIGEDAPTEKLTIRTGPGEYGISHRTTNGIWLASHIGQANTSFGTRSNNDLRLVTNNISRLSIKNDGRIGVGTENPVYLFEVSGIMRAKEIIVETTNWPDYVFAKGYALTPLDDLEQFIKEHNHLPNIPAACELEEGGLKVGEVQKQMMEKIEELTLYIIALKKEIDAIRLSK